MYNRHKTTISLHLLWASLACIAAWTGFSNPVLHFPAMVALVPGCLMRIGLEAPTPLKAFKRGFFTATIAYAVCLYWVAIPLHDHGGLSWFLAAPCPILLSMYLALFGGLFTLGINLVGIGLTGIPLALLCASWWVAIEVLREHLFTGFPWLTTASAFAIWPVILQAASVVGGIGLGFIAAFIGSLLFLGNKIHSIPRITALVFSALLWGFGTMVLNAPLPDAPKAMVSIVQGNIDQSMKWDEDFQIGTIERYETLSLKAKQEDDPDLIVWPETAMPFYLQDLTPLAMRVRGFIRRNNLTVLTGTPGYRLKVAEKDYDIFNRCYLMSPETGMTEFYDKAHLLPFGEYVPLGKYLPLGKMVEGEDFSEGTDPSPLVKGKLALGMLICYEAIFPALAQERVDAGANLLVNISNDAWFGRSSAPLQHLHLSSVRAVEQGRYLIRGTNTGISCFVDPKGIIHQATDIYRASVISQNVALHDHTTFFHKYYTIIHYILYSLCTIMFIVGAALRPTKG